MMDERDELLREIGATLSIEPTPEFAAKVRTEIRASSPVSFPTRYVMAGVTAVLALLATVSLSIRQETRSTTTESSQVPASRRAGDDIQLARESESRFQNPSTVASARHTTRSATTRQSPRRTIVPADEVEAFWRLVAAVRADELTIPRPRWPISDGTGEIEPLPEITAIEIAPVSIQLLPGTEGIEGEDKVGGTDD